MATEGLKNAIANKTNTQLQNQTSQPTIFDLIQKQKPAFAMALYWAR